MVCDNTTTGHTCIASSASMLALSESFFFFMHVNMRPNNRNLETQKISESVKMSYYSHRWVCLMSMNHKPLTLIESKEYWFLALRTVYFYVADCS